MKDRNLVIDLTADIEIELDRLHTAARVVERTWRTATHPRDRIDARREHLDLMRRIDRIERSRP